MWYGHMSHAVLFVGMAKQTIVEEIVVQDVFVPVVPLSTSAVTIFKALPFFFFFF